MSDLHEALDKAKQLLQLPALLERLGLGEHAKKSARCPFPDHPDKRKSFSVFQKDGKWFWKCFSQCGEGDEISFLEKYKGYSTKEAIIEFLGMAGGNASLIAAKAPDCVDVDGATELPPAPAPYTPPPLTLLPASLQEYVHAAAKALNVDVAYVLLPILSSLASAIGNSRSIQLKPGFIQPPIIWTGVVGRSGSRKSPALEAGCFAVMEQERELARGNKTAKEIYQEEFATWESKGRRERGPKPEPPTSLTCLMDDLTLAALAEALESNPHGVLEKKDELSQWFASFDQFTNARGADVGSWLSLHTGVMFGLDRKTDHQRFRLWQPRVSIVGGIQPAVLSRVLTPDFFERGLAARFLLATPPVTPDRWSEATIPDTVKTAVLQLFDKLYQLRPNQENDKPILLDLDTDAKTAYVAYYNECGATAVESDERGEAAWSKLSGYAARLALVGQLARDPQSKRVSGEVMQAACELARWFGGEAVRIYASLSETPEQRAQQKLIEFIESRGDIVTIRDVMQCHLPLKNQKEKTEAALDALVTAGRGKWEPVGTTAKGGRPTRLFQLLRASTSTKPAHSREKAGGCVDVDRGSSQKITVVKGEPFTDEDGREWFKYPEGMLCKDAELPAEYFEPLGALVYPFNEPEWVYHEPSGRKQPPNGFPGLPKCEVCSESETDAHWWFNIKTYAVHCQDCRETHWWADGYEIDEWGMPSCWDSSHTREQRIAERERDFLQKHQRYALEHPDIARVLPEYDQEVSRLTAIIDGGGAVESEGFIDV